MKKITSIIIFILTISLIFIVYLVIKNPKDENIYINIPLGESRKINDLNEDYIVSNDIITVDENNNIWGIKKGEATLKTNNQKYNIKVVEPTKDINYRYDKIVLDVSQSKQIDYILKENIEIIKYEYDSNIIELKSNTIKALKEGTTTLRAITNKGTYKDINIIVKDINISLSTKKVDLLIGETKKVTLYSSIPINKENIIWSVNTDIVNINYGIDNITLKGIKKGTTTINVKVNEKVLTLTINVNDNVDSLVLNSSFVNLNKNEEFEIKSNIPNELVNFKIYDTNVAIFKNNKIFALNNGKTILEASIYDKKYYTVIYVGNYNIKNNINYDINNFIPFFNEIALSNEYTINESSKKIQKWNKPIYYKYTNASEEDIKQIKYVVGILNNIPGFPGMYYKENDYDLSIDFISYDKLYGIIKVQGVEGYSTIDFNNDIIYKSNIYINSNLDNNIKRSVICEEILHSIGLKNDSKLIPNSVLYEYGSKVEDLSDYDLLAVNILYSTYINYGMSDVAVNKILNNILK